MSRFLIPGLTLIGLLLSACNSSTLPTPKPRAFPKVEFPERNYRTVSQSNCNFSFEFPDYARVEQDTAFFEERPVHPCWFDLYVPRFDCRLHCSYYPVGVSKSLQELKDDAFELANWHNKRANYIEEIPLWNEERELYGVAFRIEGPAASPFQFFLTDNEDHFLRGALYFNTQARPDSLAPVVAFVEADILNLIETFRWSDQ